MYASDLMPTLILTFCRICCILVGAFIPLWILPSSFGGLSAGAFFIQFGVQVSIMLSYNQGTQQFFNREHGAWFVKHNNLDY